MHHFLLLQQLWKYHTLDVSQKAERNWKSLTNLSATRSHVAFSLYNVRCTPKYNCLNAKNESLIRNEQICFIIVFCVSVYITSSLVTYKNQNFNNDNSLFLLKDYK